MSGYYTLHENLGVKPVSIDIYEDCSVYDHTRKGACCPLCNRPVEGSVWVGEPRFYVRTANLPDILFPLAPVYMLFSERFVEAFTRKGLTGIEELRECKIFYKKERLPVRYYIPTISYSRKAIAYTTARNAKRKTDKTLPKCSLCMNPDHEKDALYFDGEHEFDIFCRYDRKGKLFCTEAFKELCLEGVLKHVTFLEVRL